MSRRGNHINVKPRTEESRWTRCQGAMRCAYGCSIQRGDWVRWGRNQTPMCAACASTRYGLKPPAPVFGCRADAVIDVRDRQAGGD